jgi:hypothetical protein
MIRKQDAYGSEKRIARELREQRGTPILRRLQRLGDLLSELVTAHGRIRCGRCRCMLIHMQSTAI